MDQKYKLTTTGRKAATGGSASGIIAILVIKLIGPWVMNIVSGFGIDVGQDTVDATLIGFIHSVWVGLVNWLKFIWRGKMRPWLEIRGLVPARGSK